MYDRCLLIDFQWESAARFQQRKITWYPQTVSYSSFLSAPFQIEKNKMLNECKGIK
jgi:hypothetical protein